MRNSRCPLFVVGALLALGLLVPSAATADVFGSLDAAQIQSGPSVTTDKADYEPGAPVVLTGSGWQPGESVDIVVDDDGLQAEAWQHTATVVADETGSFVYQFDLPDYVVADYFVTATGSSGTASTAFTDSHVERGCGVAPTLVVNTTSDDFSATDDGVCSLREAIVASNAHPEVTDIDLDADTYTLTIPRDSSNDDGEDGDLDVSESVSINGAGKSATIVEGGTTPGTGVDRVFHLRTPGTDLDLNDFTLRHGFTNTAGGGIRAEDGSMAAPNSLDLTNMMVTLNRMTGGNGGAGLYVVAFNIDTTVTNSDFVDNDTASNCTGCDGGAIFNRGRSLDIDDSHLDGNSAGGKAGGLWNTNGGQVTIDDSTVNNNDNNNAGASDLDGLGGGIYQADEDSFMTITNSEVNGNTAQGRGGGIYITNGRLIMDHSEVNDNTLNGPRDGGGIFSSSALENPPAVQILDSTVARNSTGRSGGGYFDNQNTNHDSLLVKRSTFNDNTAAVDGGGLNIRMDATIANTTIDNNHAGSEGGGIRLIDKVVNLYNVTISDNDAPTGSGLRRNGGEANDGVYNLRNTILANNACSAETNANNPIGDAFVNVTNNLDTGTTCDFGSANNSQSSADPELGPLQDNGGPTFTRAIGGTSDALDTGNDAVCTAAPVDAIDQRHVPRPQGAHCDIGAYERAATIAGVKFNDLDMEGDKDGGEPGLEGWVINAYADPDESGTLTGAEATASPVATDTTDADGKYKLALGAGDYVVCEVLQPAWTQSMPDPADGECDAVAGAGDGGYAATDLEVGDDLIDFDFGNFESGATVSGVKYDDENEDGVNDLDPDDPGLEGWVIEAYADDNGNDVVDNGEENSPVASDTTDSTGAYELTLAAGVYIICEQLQGDWAQSEPSNVACANVPGAADGGHVFALAAGQAETGRDFGNYAGLVRGKKTDEADNPLQGWVINAYDDADDNGIVDSGEDTPVASATTAADGTYTIGLQDGDYIICEELQTGWTQLAPNPGSGDCSGVAGAAPEGHRILDLETEDEFLDKDFQNQEEPDTGTVSGMKYDDQDTDGTNAVDPDDPGLEGWTIEAYADDGAGAATGPSLESEQTDADGNYTLTLAPGDYVICEQIPTGWVQSDPAPGDGDCAGVTGAASEGHLATVTTGNDVPDKDFGNYRTADVTVYKTYSDGSTAPAVDVRLECDNGFDETDESDPAGDPAEFTVDGFADGDTCDVTEVEDVPGYTADTSDCEGLELSPGADLSCTVVNVEEATIVTNGGCTFDRVDDRSGHQFPAIFTPQTGGYYKLSSTNPGQFFLNVVYDGNEGDEIDITVPFPFVTVGPSAIDVHEDVTAGPNGSGKMCFHPKGKLLSKENDSVTWNYGAGGETFGATKTITVTAPEDGLVYVRIHLAYGLKSVAGMCTKGAGTPPSADCTSPANHHFDGYEPYPFSFTGPNDDGGGTVESFNVFKKNPGIGSLALRTVSGDAVPATTVEYWLGTKKMGSLDTDEDGWSMWTYKYTGKAATFTVKIPSYGLSKSVTMKSNGYVSVNFSVADGAVPITPAPTPTPTPTPTKPGGKK